MADKAALDSATLEFLDAAALPILLAISNALTGLLATFFPKLTVALPTLKEIFQCICFYCCVTDIH